MATIDVKDAEGDVVAVELPLTPGRAAAASSRPVALSNEDNAAIGALTETAPATDTASSGLNGRLQRIAQRLTSLIALLPASLGTKTSALSLPVTLSSDGPFVVATGTVADAAWASGNGTIIGLLKAVAAAVFPAASTYRVASAAATVNAANIKSSAGTVKSIQGYNAKATAVYLRLYNKATSPTVGTDVPQKALYLPATAAFAFDFGAGVSFSTGIGIGMTGAGGDTDATALAAGDILALNVDYI